MGKVFESTVLVKTEANAYSIQESKNAKIAGVMVNEGSIKRGNTIHLIRNNQLVHKGPIRSLRHFKDDVRELNSGFEGGIVLETFQDIKEGDMLEAHSLEIK